MRQSAMLAALCGGLRLLALRRRDRMPARLHAYSPSCIYAFGYSFHVCLSFSLLSCCSFSLPPTRETVLNSKELCAAVNQIGCACTMVQLTELYDYYCRRLGCHPNSEFNAYLKSIGNRELTDVNVSTNYLGKKGIIPVLDLVKNTKTVTLLDLSNNMLEHEQLDHLVYCLALHPRIRHVNLSDNCLHEGSADHVIKLLELNPSIVRVDLSGNDFLPASVAIIDALCEENQKKQDAQTAEDAAVDALISANRAQRASYRAVVEGALESEGTSGGYVSFTTWWKNPQYRVQISRSSQVAFTMTASSQASALQAGFVVMRHDGVRRVIELEPTTVVAESNIDSSYCSVEVDLEADEHYVVMPYTFRPGKPMSFTLTATMLNEAPSLEEGWITVSPLDSQYDWVTHDIQGEWAEGNNGGGPDLHTWRRNPMYHLTRAATADVLPSDDTMVTICVQVAACADPDVEDGRQLGLDVVLPDRHDGTKPPLICTPEVSILSLPHSSAGVVFAKFAVPYSALDLYVVPSAKTADQQGLYTLTVFTSWPTDCSTSAFPHSWHHRVVRGCWDDQMCGGSRGASQSWKNNPAAEVIFEASAVPQVLSVFVEPQVTAERRVSAEVEMDADADADADDGNVKLDVATEQRMLEEKAFLLRHRPREVEVCVSAVLEDTPAYTELRTSALSTTEAQLELPYELLQAADRLYVVPMTRHAGSQAAFDLHVFGDAPFVITGVDVLALRERQAQLDQYALENQQRSAPALGGRGGVNSTRDAPNNSSVRRRLPSESPETAIMRMDILRQFLSHRTKFVDRDFPRGTSSLFLDPLARPPPSFPSEYTWKRASEVCGERNEDVECLRFGEVSPPVPRGKRQWFASVIQAVAAKPHWINRLLAHYDADAGFAQVRFFKNHAWVNVTVDDYFPVDSANTLCMGCSVHAQDYFYPLVEKAYAKVHRCYEALEPKVTPELTLIELFMQGLTDVSGGLCTHRVLRTTAVTSTLTQDDRHDIWMELKRSVNRSVLHALLLRSESPSASEKRAVGILPDQLYGVLDARFIEGQRLVKVRNWAHEPDTQWKGKWAPHSSHWSDTLLSVLQYKHSASEIWMSFDEVLYYFSDLLSVDDCHCPSLYQGDFAPPVGALSGCGGTNPQYSLSVAANEDEASGPVEVLIGLHQSDARMSITRDADAVAKYRYPLGFVVVRTDDNTRYVQKFSDDQVALMASPARARDVYGRLVVRPSATPLNFIVMPFKEKESDGNTAFTLSVSSLSPWGQVSSSVVDSDQLTTVSGAWRQRTAGGPPSCPSWCDNQQFFLFPSDNVTATVTLVRTTPAPVGTPTPRLGFTIHTTQKCASFLHFEEDTVVHHETASSDAETVGATLALRGMRARRGMPYVIVPYSDQPGAEADFELRVVCNKKIVLSMVEPRLDWHRQWHHVCLRAQDGNVGGSPRFPSWRYSPQYVLDFPVQREGHVRLVLSNNNAVDLESEFGMLLLRADMRYGEGRRRRVEYAASDVVGPSAEGASRVELELDVDLVGHDEPLILVVYSLLPYKELDLELACYSAPEMVVQPVVEWKSTTALDGAWELGLTAGGGRSTCPSWINNPFFGITTIRRTRAVALLIQYPRGPEKPIMKRYGNEKRSLPPPITNVASRMAIELEEVAFDAELTTVGHAGPTKDMEVVLHLDLDGTQDKPHLLVPSTAVSEQNGDFKLIVFADSVVDVYPISKERLPYT